MAKDRVVSAVGVRSAENYLRTFTSNYRKTLYIYIYIYIIRTANALNQYLLRWTVIPEFQPHGSCSASHQIKHLFQLHASVNIDG